MYCHYSQRNKNCFQSIKAPRCSRFLCTISFDVKILYFYPARPKNKPEKNNKVDAVPQNKYSDLFIISMQRRPFKCMSFHNRRSYLSKVRLLHSHFYMSKVFGLNVVNSIGNMKCTSTIIPDILSTRSQLYLLF